MAWGWPRSITRLRGGKTAAAQSGRRPPAGLCGRPPSQWVTLAARGRSRAPPPPCPGAHASAGTTPTGIPG
jgi:hypothetical protein